MTVTRTSNTTSAMRQVRFGTSLGINRTLEQIQEAQRAGMRQRFHLRRATFIERLVKIRTEDRATKSRLWGVVGIQGDRASVLTQHEPGMFKVPRGRSIAIPVEVKRNKADIITAAQRPRQLLAKKPARVFVGETKGGDPAILQRVGRGKKGTLRVLYKLQKRAALKPRLRFRATALRVAKARLARNVADGITRAFRSAR